MSADDVIFTKFIKLVLILYSSDLFYLKGKDIKLGYASTFQLKIFHNTVVILQIYHHHVSYGRMKCFEV